MKEFKKTETLTYPPYTVNIDEGRKHITFYVKFSLQLLATCILCSEIQTQFGMKTYQSRMDQVA